jgi:uncharacterized protein (TIGR03382 family)
MHFQEVPRFADAPWMRCRHVLGVALLCASTAHAETNGTQPDTQIDGDNVTEIIGGTRGTSGQYPTVVAITAGGGICTGTLVHQDWVLTAAHCVSPAVLRLSSQQAVTDSVRVYFNTTAISGTPTSQIRRASMTIPKPTFNISALGSNDIGLIKLAAPITGIEPSPINFEAAMAPVGITVTMVGFGVTEQNPDSSSPSGTMYVLTGRTSTSCSQFGAGSNTNLLCFNQTDAKGKCSGDSGGPSFAMINGKQTVVGVTSFGDQGCTTFGADTRTDIEKSFLLMHAPQLEAKCMMDSECPNMGICFNGQCMAQPFTGNGLGATCTSGAGCESGVCADGPGGMKCTMTCMPSTAGVCPSGFECLDTGGGGGACWPEGEGDSGCCDASGKGAPTALFGMMLFAFVLRRRRR